MKRILAGILAAAAIGLGLFGETLIGITGTFYPYPEEPYSLFSPGFAVGYDAGPLIALFEVSPSMEVDPGVYAVPVVLSVLPTLPLPGDVRALIGIDLSGAFIYSEDEGWGFAFWVGPGWGIRLGLDWETGIHAGAFHAQLAWLLPTRFQVGFLYEFGSPEPGSE